MEEKKPKVCNACQGELEFLGQVPVRTKGHEGLSKLIFGNWTEISEEIWPIDIFRCKKCARLEMYDLDFSLKKE